MKLPHSSLLKSSKAQSAHKDETTSEIPSMLPEIVSQSSASTCSRNQSNKKSSILVFHASKKLPLSLLSHLTLSTLMMILLSLIYLFTFSFPVAECIKASSFYHSIPYNARHSQLHHASNRYARFFPNLPINLPSIRETIPSSRSTSRASKLKCIAYIKRRV